MWRAPKLKTADIDGQLTDHDGIDTEVLRGSICPCADYETGSADETCSSCFGWGYTYPADRKIAALKVQWLGQSSRKEYDRAGVYTPGSVQVTWPSTTVLGHGDIFIHPYEEAVETSERLIRGQVDPDGDTMERLRFSRVTGVEDVRDSVRAYTAGVDFNLAADGHTFVWIDGGQKPAIGARYSVRYRYRSMYIIGSATPQQRHDDGALAWHTTVERFAGVNRQGGKVLGHD